MQVNTLPLYDETENTTGCCPRFKPENWENRELHFKDKLFVRAITHSLMQIPVDMGRIFTRVQTHMEQDGAYDPTDFVVLSRDTSPWNAEHLFAVTRPVENEEMVTLSGDFLTKVFEGPYRNAKDWYSEMEKTVAQHGRVPGTVWFFYTTCPKCARAYGKNYVVGIAEMI